MQLKSSASVVLRPNEHAVFAANIAGNIHTASSGAVCLHWPTFAGTTGEP